MITRNEVISIGTLRRTHGKSGEIQCQTTNELWDEADPEFLILNINTILVPFRVLDWRSKGEDLIFRLKGIDTEPAAQRLIGCEACMLRRDVVGEEEQLTTWQDLVGWQVIDTDQGELGTIRSVDESTANTLIELIDGRFIPIHEDFIVSLDNSILTITLPFILP